MPKCLLFIGFSFINTINATNCINLNIHHILFKTNSTPGFLITVNVSHGSEIFMKRSEIFMKCSVVTGSITINFAGVSFCFLFTSNCHSFLQARADISLLLPPLHHPFLSTHRSSSLPTPATPLPAFLPLALQKESTTWSNSPANCLGCSYLKCRQGSGLTLHLQPAEISIVIVVSKQHKLGCMELVGNTATDLLRWAGGI